MTIPAGGFVRGVGGTDVGVNDRYWVRAKVALDGDLQIIEYNQDRPRVKEIVEDLKKR